MAVLVSIETVVVVFGQKGDKPSIMIDIFDFLMFKVFFSRYKNTPYM